MINLSDEYLELLKKAVNSHDGITRKRATIILAASKTNSMEEVALSTGYSKRSVLDVISRLRNTDPQSFLQSRPKPARATFNNWLVSSYEGAEWQYYRGALSHGPMENSLAVIKRIREIYPDPGGVSRIRQVNWVSKNKLSVLD